MRGVLGFVGLRVREGREARGGAAGKSTTTNKGGLGRTGYCNLICSDGVKKCMLSPLPAHQWNLRTAAHLLSRAGFGGVPAEIERLARLDPDKAVAELVDYDAIPDPTPAPDWARPDPERLEKLQAYRRAGAEEKKALRRMEQRSQRERLLELRRWWLDRMARGPRPLQEKLTLFWHGHFATSVVKVKDAYLMWRQNQTLRENAQGSWLQLLTAMAQDPAMLIWLDQAQSRRQHPNENFARELMELFALGEGHYTETDVTEAARALTGWTLDRGRQQFEDRARLHDSGVKTVLGQTGDLDGNDVLRRIVERPQSARFICGKLWRFFASENPPAELIGGLARVFEEHGRQFKPVLRALFRSEEFYASEVVCNQVKSPVQWLVGSVRLLDRTLPATLVTSQLLSRLGQDLFAPPNVKGWDGGLAWITTNNLLNRYNEAALLVQGAAALGRGAGRARARQTSGKPMRARVAPVNVKRIFTEEERSHRATLVAAVERRFLQARLKPQQEQVLRDYLDSQGDLDEDDILNTIRLVMSTPEYQIA